MGQNRDFKSLASFDMFCKKYEAKTFKCAVEKPAGINIVQLHGHSKIQLFWHLDLFSFTRYCHPSKTWQTRTHTDGIEYSSIWIYNSFRRKTLALRIVPLNSLLASKYLMNVLLDWQQDNAWVMLTDWEVNDLWKFFFFLPTDYE